MISVGQGGVAAQTGVDGGPALTRPIRALKDEHARPFAEHHAEAIDVEWTTGLVGIGLRLEHLVIARAEEHQGTDRAIGPAGNRDVDLA